MKIVGQKVLNGVLLNWVQYDDGVYGGFLEDLDSVDASSRVLEDSIVYKESQVIRGSVVFGGSKVSGGWVVDSRLDGTDTRMSYISGSTVVLSNLENCEVYCSTVTQCDIAPHVKVFDSELSITIVQGKFLSVRNSEIHRTNFEADFFTINGMSLIDGKNYLILGPAPSSGRYTLFYRSKIGINVTTGCFGGTIEAFRNAVKKTHRDNQRYREWYLNAIKVAKKCIKL